MRRTCQPGETVSGGNEDCVPERVVVELVVRGESDEGAPARTEGEENLHRSVGPHLHHYIQSLSNLARADTLLEMDSTTLF